MSIEFEAIAAAALAQAPQLLSAWLGGKQVGNEWKGARKAVGGPGDSWSINLANGCWLHGSGLERGGDLISLYAALNGVDQGIAARAVAELAGLPATTPAHTNGHSQRTESRPEPIPPDAPPIPDHPTHGRASAQYVYGSAFIVARYDLADGKQFSPLTWRAGKWHFKGYPDPKPLYNLALLHKYAELPVLIVEGEKCADAAKIWRTYVATTWAHGAQAVKKTDWSPLAGRDVLIWPDNDAAGREAAAKIAELLASSAKRVRIIDPSGEAEGYDIADAVAAGLKAKEITDWARSRVKALVQPVPAAVPDPEPSAVLTQQSLPLDRNEGGVPYPTAANVSAIVLCHDKFADHVWFDSFRNSIWHDLSGTPAPWTDLTETNFLIWCQQSLRMPKLTVTAVRQGITSAAAQRERNSVTRWLDALKWDGRARLGSWMTDYLGTPNDDYHCRIGRNWLISMVARAYQPGCQVDTVPVLQGAMGKGKSSAVAILGGEWFAALPENFGSVDFFQCIQGKWLIEIPDLAGFRGRDHTIIISAISRRVDTYRASYGHHPEDRPRRTVFAITTELSAEYLSEGRGRRRFWPIECSTIDCTALATDREQLFAEAMAAYRSGEKWWEVTDDIAERQDVLVSEHPWTRSVLAYCKGKEVLGVHAGDILELALSIRLQDQHDGQKGIVSKILSMDGWKQNNTSRKGERLRVWRKI